MSRQMGRCAVASSALLFFFFWRLVEAQDVASRDASGYERGRQSEPDNYMCNRQRFAHTPKTIIEGFAYQSGVFPGGIFQQSYRIFPSCPQGGVQAFLCEAFGFFAPCRLVAFKTSLPLLQSAQMRCIPANPLFSTTGRGTDPATRRCE